VSKQALLLAILLLLPWRPTLPALSQSPPNLPSSLSAQAAGHCLALPPPSGNVLNVSTVSALVDAVNAASSGDTILLADGTYSLNGAYLWIDVAHVTLRSANGNREAVILDGNYNTTEIITVAASGVTIADLTIQRAQTHPIHVVTTGADTLDTLVYNVHIVDPGQQAIKINPGGGGYPDGGEIACSHIELTNAGRAEVWNINGSCYTGGVDAHQAMGWTIRDNTIEGFWCPGEGGGCDGHELSEHGIHLWRGCRDTIVERNTLTNNARGVGFGLATSGDARTYADDPCPSASGYVDHYGGIIRNNFVFANQGELFASDCGYDSGISLWQACNAKVFHNTVASTAAPFSSIEWRFSNTDAEITNNLVTHNLMERDSASAVQVGNLEYQPLSLFIDGSGGDLHLASTATVAIDRVSAPPGVTDDIDGDARPIGAASDVGADEYGVPASAAVTDLRVTDASASMGSLTATLRWTAPGEALTTTLRYDDALLTEGTWSSSTILTDSLPGGIDAYTATVPYEGGTVYFALRSENQGGVSGLSNNAFWPHWDVLLPIVLREQ
jgi:hypothetical protein